MVGEREEKMQTEIHVRGSIVGLKPPENDDDEPRRSLVLIGFVLRDTLKVFGECADYERIMMTQCCYEQKIISMYLTQIDDMDYVKQAVYLTLLDDLHMDPHSAEIAKTPVAAAIANMKRDTNCLNPTFFTILMEIQIDFLTKKHGGPPSEPSGEHGYASLLERLEDDCGICHNDSPNNIVVTTCHHVYHNACIFEWFCQGTRTCPTCRSDLSIMVGHTIEFP